ncbi:hypothetical protein A0U90_10025 [Kozakia baliensis]|nr:hypothetical protein A0U90_10025 [Kozakia baliensis]
MAGVMQFFHYLALHRHMTKREASSLKLKKLRDAMQKDLSEIGDSFDRGLDTVRLNTPKLPYSDQRHVS